MWDHDKKDDDFHRHVFVAFRVRGREFSKTTEDQVGNNAHLTGAIIHLEARIEEQFEFSRDNVDEITEADFAGLSH